MFLSDKEYASFVGCDSVTLETVCGDQTIINDLFVYDELLPAAGLKCIQSTIWSIGSEEEKTIVSFDFVCTRKGYDLLFLVRDELITCVLDPEKIKFVCDWTKRITARSKGEVLYSKPTDVYRLSYMVYPLVKCGHRESADTYVATVFSAFKTAISNQEGCAEANNALFNIFNRGNK